jgi:hypothetical protein
MLLSDSDHMLRFDHLVTLLTSDHTLTTIKTKQDQHSLACDCSQDIQYLRQRLVVPGINILKHHVVL